MQQEGPPVARPTMNRGLTAVRAVAIILVFLAHAQLFDSGYLGVLLFFVLSGFLLTPILVDMKERMVLGTYLMRFYGRRSLRIFPLYYAYLAVVGCAFLWSIKAGGQNDAGALQTAGSQLGWAATYLYNFLHVRSGFHSTPFLTHFWSLAVEEQYYLVWPLAIWITPARNLRWMLLTLLCAAPLLRFAFGSIAQSQLLPGFSTDKLIVSYVLPFSYLDAFAIGGYAALYRTAPTRLALCVHFALTCALGWITNYMTDGDFAPWSFGYPVFMGSGCGKYIWGYSAVNLFFANFILALRDRTFAPQLFEHRLVEHLGTLSYGLYVYHFGVIYLVSLWLPAGSLLLQAAVAFAASVLIATLSYERFEKRFTDMKDRFFARA